MTSSSTIKNFISGEGNIYLTKNVINFFANFSKIFKLLSIFAMYQVFNFWIHGGTIASIAPPSRPSPKSTV